ncbi:hypothetical protein V6N13_027107 [Hibiscus sabdariffa]|uniref:Uncharacterized protein n=2 Tax=Hibiscus sabdariffa TaxID=183260 RepID=A0ABR2B268_9ROSI
MHIKPFVSKDQCCTSILKLVLGSKTFDHTPPLATLVEPEESDASKLESMVEEAPPMVKVDEVSDFPEGEVSMCTELPEDMSPKSKVDITLNFLGEEGPMQEVLPKGLLKLSKVVGTSYFKEEIPGCTKLRGGGMPPRSNVDNTPSFKGVERR